MPKIELHVHVEGATKPEVYYSLAKKNNVKLPVSSIDEWKAYFEFSSFSHFINVYIKAISALKKPADYAFLIEHFYAYQASQNIVYTEAFLSASFLVNRFKQNEILDAIERGIKKGEEKHRVKINFIPDIARNFPETQKEVLNFVIAGKKRGIFIGLGLGGLENAYPPAIFRDVFAEAKRNDLHIVAHAGELLGAKSIWAAIYELKVERIGHGISCLEDDKLIAYLQETQIPIEVSPTSNYRLNLVKEELNHPIRQMIDTGIFCTLNSDDPAMFSTSLNNEYLLLAEQGFTMEELIHLNKNALEASFLSKSEKAYFDNILDNWPDDKQ